MKESALQSQILAYLKWRGIFCWRNNTGGVYRNGRYMTYGLPGAGDIIGVLPGGRFLSIEVKAPGAGTKKERAELQASFRDAVNGKGGLAIEARSVEDVVAFLGEGQHEKLY